MTSRKLSFMDDNGLDQVLTAAFRDGVGAERPSARVRESLLRAAAERQHARLEARRTNDAWPRIESSEITRDWSTRSVTISPSTVLVLHAQVLSLRVVQ